MGFKKHLDPDFLTSLGLYSIESKYKSSFRGLIPTNYSCLDRLVDYYKIYKSTDEIPSILKVKTPSVVNIFSENNITYKITINNVLMGTFGFQDMNFIFRKEFLTYKLEILQL